MSKPDVCLILEEPKLGQQAEMAVWTDQLIRSLPELRFGLFVVWPPDQPEIPPFNLPENVVDCSGLVLGRLPEGSKAIRGGADLFRRLEAPLRRVFAGGGLSDLTELSGVVQPFRQALGSHFLLNSKPAWELVQRMYADSMPDRSFFDYFWAWRTLVSELMSVLLAPVPEAHVYHGLSSGYAGLVLTHAQIITRRPVVLTDHSAHALERRVELSLANWLFRLRQKDHQAPDRVDYPLRQVWAQTFSTYARASYEASTEIITFFEENHTALQRERLAAGKLRLIPTGVAVLGQEGNARRNDDVGAIAFIGPMTPRHDVLTFLRTAALLSEMVPGLRFIIVGASNYDDAYASECRNALASLKLSRSVTLLDQGQEPPWSEIQVVVQTRIHDAEGLGILQSGAHGIPVVATDVGPTRELVLGSFRESPALGSGGEVIGLASPETAANAVYRLLSDATWYQLCARTLRQRVQLYYERDRMIGSYKSLYLYYKEAEPQNEGGVRWPG